MKTTLDYEQFQTRNTNLTVTCSDGFCTSPAAFLYVRVTDVNEPITLYPQDFTLSTYEGSVSDSVIYLHNTTKWRDSVAHALFVELLNMYIKKNKKIKK